MSAALAAVVSTAAIAPKANAQSTAGPYLAGRQAIVQSDYAAASRYYVQALARDTNNAELMEGATLSFLSLGDISRAAPIAARIEAAGLRSQTAHMVSIAELLIAEDYDGYLARDADTMGIGPLVDTLIAAWATLGQGNADAAFAQFDAVSTEAGMSGFAMYHKAMAYGLVGDFENAEALYADYGAGAMNRTRRGIVARAEGLSQLGRNDDALQSLRLAFGEATDPELSILIEALEAGETVPFTHITSARDGAAEVFFSLASALRGEASPDYTLLYGRMAHALRPDHVDALLLNAELLEELGQYDLAIAAYKAVPSKHTASHAAELGRAAALRRSDKVDAAIEVLEQLSRRFPDMAAVQSTLGDVLRQKEDYEDAVAAYDRAIDLIPEGGRGAWFTHYARAIAHERLDNWELAEADFRKALELNPGQPQVLNYLGYSMVEQQVNLDEALEMIEQAVAAEPASGYIVDSLGWVLYRLGRYEEAVGHMERAVELEPVDPVVNDHLGDVYWAVGRAREAEFQWKRALSFVDPTDTDSEAEPDRMRRKLEVGLDAVLEMEGAPPLKVANDD
ncbi:tetratricopeptide repeat protein [Pseudosulfitobacter sp. SM2401]|uniref:tetratricopeptide repeat protein n=1 Tax=Pseudosulfitobacter sp. SM2401 TaxID=3350098 RepID=UPI0036F32D0C